MQSNITTIAYPGTGSTTGWFIHFVIFQWQFDDNKNKIIIIVIIIELILCSYLDVFFFFFASLYIYIN